VVFVDHEACIVRIFASARTGRVRFALAAHGVLALHVRICTRQGFVLVVLLPKLTVFLGA
jgi:hypothetical protein